MSITLILEGRRGVVGVGETAMTSSERDEVTFVGPNSTF
jgi:hypothetical protein